MKVFGWILTRARTLEAERRALHALSGDYVVARKRLRQEWAKNDALRAALKGAGVAEPWVPALETDEEAGDLVPRCNLCGRSWGR
jgi:uncharacterized protein (DUF488 family)